MQVSAEEQGMLTVDPEDRAMSTTAEPASILTSTADGVMTITLNRPEKLNSFNAAMSLALIAALRSAADEAIRAVVLTGAGKGFCAGQDLSDRMVVATGGSIDLAETIEKNWSPVVRAIRNLPKPVVCAVNGVAAGAGANLALGCDLVYAARSAKFIQPFAKLGLVPDAGGTYHLPRLVGEARAKGLALLAEPISAEQAASWGMIWKVVDDASLMAEVRAVAATLATQPTFGFGLIKQAIHASAAHTLDQQLDLERDLQRLAGHSPDYAEGVRGFMEKRQPVFTGKAKR
jgi:2-(1,2-epoxy-1,2-dihydrophenyl)acetyl-CoA isomerase